MASETDLSATLLKVAKGDRDALRSLYVRQSARMFGLALAILRDRTAAADAVQEGFVRIWDQARSFDPAHCAAETWIAGAVRYAALELARLRGREMPTGDQASDGFIIDADALDGLLATEPGKHLRQALLRLDADSRRALVLAYLNGLSYGELAAELDLPMAKIPAWLHRAMLTLRAGTL